MATDYQNTTVQWVNTTASDVQWVNTTASDLQNWQTITAPQVPTWSPPSSPTPEQIIRGMEEKGFFLSDRAKEALREVMADAAWNGQPMYFTATVCGP